VIAMKIARLYTGKDQQSHFEEVELSFDAAQAVQTTALQKANNVVFRLAPVGHAIDWHPAPRRQYVVTLSGSWEIEVGGGVKRLFKPGDVMLAEDLTGRGHVSHVVGSEPHVFMTVPLAE
jgi:quercetin dioxygenase-like cupin family protein